MPCSFPQAESSCQRGGTVLSPSSRVVFTARGQQLCLCPRWSSRKHRWSYGLDVLMAFTEHPFFCVPPARCPPREVWAGTQAPGPERSAVGTRLPAARSTGQSWRPCGKHCVLMEPRDLWGATRTPVCGARPLHEGRRMGGQAAAPRVSREHSAASLVPRGTQKSPSGRIWGSCKS